MPKASKGSVSNYAAKDIQELEGLEAVRRRPGMYVGGTDVKALHHLVYEVVDNSIDEAPAGACSAIDVPILPDRRPRRAGRARPAGGGALRGRGARGAPTAPRRPSSSTARSSRATSSTASKRWF